MRLTDRELNWVLDSPVFYGPLASQCASGQLQSESFISLPGPIVHVNNIECPNTQTTSDLLSDRHAREKCSLEVEQQLSVFHTGRLGLVFEKYLENIFREKFGDANTITRVAVREETPSIGGVKTWGEFDFLVHNLALKRTEHWESSIKFYLQVSRQPEWKFCWGPGVRDRLDLKGTKTFLQKLPLSSTELGHKCIPKPWRDLPLAKIVFAKGTIFYQWEPERESFNKCLANIVSPVGLSPDHLKSWWILPQCVKALREQFPAAKISVVPRRYWMTGLPADLLQSNLEDWDEFVCNLETRLNILSERQECMLVGLHDRHEPFELMQMGFIAAPHFLRALDEFASVQR